MANINISFAYTNIYYIISWNSFIEEQERDPLARATLARIVSPFTATFPLILAHFGCGIINKGLFGHTAAIFDLLCVSNLVTVHGNLFLLIASPTLTTSSLAPTLMLQYTPLVIPQGGITIDGDILPGLHFNEINHAWRLHH